MWWRWRSTSRSPRRGDRRHPHRVAGGARRRRAPALRRRLDRPGADRGAPGARPATGRRTFGYQRSEVLAALVNGLPLVAVSVGIGIAGDRPFSDPPAIEGGGVLVLGVLGLAGNLVATVVLARGERDDINLEGVLRHSVADALGSLGVVVAGAVVLRGGSDIVDPIVGLLISVLVLFSSWRLIKEPFDVLMEAAPADLDVDGMGAAICAVEGVRSVHDLHVWTRDRRLRRPRRPRRRRPRRRPRPRSASSSRWSSARRFGIEHTTLQMEEEAGGDSSASRTPRPDLQRDLRRARLVAPRIRRREAEWRLTSLGAGEPFPRNRPRRLRGGALAACRDRARARPRRTSRPARREGIRLEEARNARASSPRRSPATGADPPADGRGGSDPRPRSGDAGAPRCRRGAAGEAASCSSGAATTSHGCATTCGGAAGAPRTAGRDV